MRLIDVDEIESKFGEYLNSTVEYMNGEEGNVFDALFDEVKSCRIVDAVEVVRCKDCVHWFGECDDGQEHSCDMDALLRPANHFCGYGKRKEST